MHPEPFGHLYTAHARHGVKVGVEIAFMCADAGLVRTDEDILALAGSGRGSDTAVIIKPSNAHTCLDLRIKQIIAKPL